jgi:NADP-dependent 3-hydroxy acid dehydrogenase YdfG
LNQGAHVFLVAQDEQILKSMAMQFPSQATVIITNICDDM